MAFTIKDVAQKAGVSVATVSRALNESGSVLPETKARILHIVQQLQFVPSGAARSLITRRTSTIGMLLPDLHGEYFSELICAVDRVAREHQLHLLLSSSHGNLDDLSIALRTMRGRVDGLLIMSPFLSRELLEASLPQGLPAVLLNTDLGISGVCEYRIDNRAGAAAMTSHLIDQGYRRIAFIQGAADNAEARLRLEGYCQTVSKRLPGVEPLLFEGDFSEASGARIAAQIAAMPVRPDAVFAANDMMAIGCLLALRGLGIRVPEDVALAGFDDIPSARYVTPALTTVHVPIAELGSRALQALMVSMTGPGTPAGVVLDAQLVVRESCMAPEHSMQT